MEEGRFDAEGNYFPYKVEEIDDAWLTSIDWENVDEEASYFNIPNTSSNIQLNFKVKSNTNISTDIKTAILPLQDCIQSILQFLNQGETVAKALNRLKPKKFEPKTRKRDHMEVSTTPPTLG